MTNDQNEFELKSRANRPAFNRNKKILVLTLLFSTIAFLLLFLPPPYYSWWEIKLNFLFCANMVVIFLVILLLTLLSELNRTIHRSIK